LQIDDNLNLKKHKVQHALPWEHSHHCWK
jgi:hypothetical protein